jgi:YbgC/YbaW family acyl-CoA thioester hydrolase
MAVDPFIVHRTVLFGECDPGGVVYAPRFASFVVDACQSFLAAAVGGPAVRMMMEMGVLPPARSLSIEFLRPATYDDVLEIEVGVAEVGTQSFTLIVDGRRGDGDRIFSARMTQVVVSTETRRPVGLPPRLRAALIARVDPERG